MIALWPLVRPEGSKGREATNQCRCCGPPMPAPRIGRGRSGDPAECRGLAFCVVERGHKLVGGRLDGLELLFGLLAHLADERKAIGWAHFAHGLRIDAFTRRLHRGGGVLEGLGVLAPGRLLSGRNAELGLQLSIWSGRQSRSPARRASCPAPCPSHPWPSSCHGHHSGPCPCAPSFRGPFHQRLGHA